MSIKKILLQHLTEPHYTELDMEKLNEQGKEGWEFVTINSGCVIFKREVKKRTVRDL